jgi:hypothetical protein
VSRRQKASASTATAASQSLNSEAFERVFASRHPTPVPNGITLCPCGRPILHLNGVPVEGSPKHCLTCSAAVIRAHYAKKHSTPRPATVEELVRERLGHKGQTTDDIADALGLKRTSVTKCMCALERVGAAVKCGRVGRSWQWRAT